MRNKLIYASFLTYFLVLTIFWYLGLGGEQHGLIFTVFYVSTVIISVICGTYLVSVYGFKNRHGKAFSLLTLGFFFWMIGEIIWLYYGFVLLESPYPSIADAFYIAAYPLFALGLIQEIRLAKIKFSNVNKPGLGVIGVLSLVITALVFYFGVIQVYVPGGTLADNLAIVYGIGDLIVTIPALFILVLAWEYKGGKIFLPWLFIFASFLITLVADVLYAIFTDQYLEWNKPFSGLDLFWIASYLLAGLGFLSIALSLKDIQKKIQPK